VILYCSLWFLFRNNVYSYTLCIFLSLNGFEEGFFIMHYISRGFTNGDRDGQYCADLHSSLYLNTRRTLWHKKRLFLHSIIDCSDYVLWHSELLEHEVTTQCKNTKDDHQLNSHQHGNLKIHVGGVLVLLICTGKLVWSSLVMLRLNKCSNHGKFLTTFHVWSMNCQLFHPLHNWWIYYIEQLTEEGLAIHFSAPITLLAVITQSQ